MFRKYQVGYLFLFPSTSPFRKYTPGVFKIFKGT